MEGCRPGEHCRRLGDPDERSRGPCPCGPESGPARVPGPVPAPGPGPVPTKCDVDLPEGRHDDAGHRESGEVMPIDDRKTAAGPVKRAGVRPGDVKHGDLGTPTSEVTRGGPGPEKNAG